MEESCLKTFKMTSKLKKVYFKYLTDAQVYFPHVGSIYILIA